MRGAGGRGRDKGERRYEMESKLEGGDVRVVLGR